MSGAGVAGSGSAGNGSGFGDGTGPRSGSLNETEMRDPVLWFLLEFKIILPRLSLS